MVGTGTAADQETNGSWVPIASSTFALQGVSCSADAACTAVGQPLQGAGLSLATLAGTGWKDVAAPEGPKVAETNTLSSVSCRAAGSCVAVGHFIGAAPRDPAKSAFGALVVTGTHGKWTVAPAVGASSADEPWLSSVSCPSAHLCLAVGTDLIDAIHVPGGGFHALAVLVEH